MSIATLFALVPVIGIGIGLSRGWLPRAPWIAAAVVLFLYAGLNAFVGIWAAQCWECFDPDTMRKDVWLSTAVFFGLLTATTLLGIWLGARMVTMLGRLQRTWNELRGNAPEESLDA